MRSKYTLRIIYDFWMSYNHSRIVPVHEISSEVDHSWGIIADYFINKADGFGMVEGFMEYLHKEQSFPKKMSQVTLPSLNEELVYVKLNKRLKRRLIETPFSDWYIGFNMPEDLFLVVNNEVLLETVIHESIIYFYLTNIELNEFELDFPNIKLVKLSGSERIG